VNANSRPSFIVQTLSFMNCSCNFICGLSDVIIKTFSQSVSSHSPAATAAIYRYFPPTGRTAVNLQ